MLQQKVQKIKESHLLESILQQGAKKASTIAKQTLNEVYQTLGIK